MDHGYRIEGNINGRSLLGLGAGKTDPATGVSEMEVGFEKLPDGWDPRTIVLMCCDRAVVMAARETDGAVGMYRASGGYLTIGRDLVNGLRWGIMRDRDVTDGSTRGRLPRSVTGTGGSGGGLHVPGARTAPSSTCRSRP